MRIRRKGDEGFEKLDELLSHAITEDIVKWYKQWNGGRELGFEAKSDIYNVILQRFKNGVEI
jgi:hypothetical protein